MNFKVIIRSNSFDRFDINYMHFRKYWNWLDDNLFHKFFQEKDPKQLKPSHEKLLCGRLLNHCWNIFPHFPALSNPLPVRPLQICQNVFRGKNSGFARCVRWLIPLIWVTPSLPPSDTDTRYRRGKHQMQQPSIPSQFSAQTPLLANLTISVCICAYMPPYMVMTLVSDTCAAAENRQYNVVGESEVGEVGQPVHFLKGWRACCWCLAHKGSLLCISMSGEEDCWFSACKWQGQEVDVHKVGEGWWVPGLPLSLPSSHCGFPMYTAPHNCDLELCCFDAVCLLLVVGLTGYCWSGWQ